MVHNLTDIEKDCLKEIGNIGTGNAATALSKLLNKHLEIVIPETKFIPIGKFADEFGGPEQVVTSTYLEITGDYTGECLFIFPVKSAEKIIDIMMNQPIGTSKIIDDMSQSAFKEMSNIFTGAYLDSMADFLQSRILPSVPHITNDMVQAIIDFMLAKVSNHSDQVLSINTKINIKDIEIEGHFIILFDNVSLNKMLIHLKKIYQL